MKVIKTADSDFESFFHNINRRREMFDARIWASVNTIVEDVARDGDTALFDYTSKFDHHILDSHTVEVSTEEWAKSAREVSKSDRKILMLAANRIRSFHRKQKTKDYRICDKDGMIVGQRVRPLDRVGIYAPGGLAIYPSTVLMASIPARIAGVKEIILVTPTKGHHLNPLISAAAQIGGVTRIFKVGGAQAIAALAYGTKSIPQVDKIVGPGNAYVAAAKKLVFGKVDIDMIAGPSEVLIIADGTGPAAFAAADLIAQAEHDEMARAVLLTTDESYAVQVNMEINEQLQRLPKKDIILRALESYGAVIITNDLDEAVDISNRIAPEHLELMVANPQELFEKIRHAGAVFLGCYTPEALGDYTAGPNHILPTSGTARFSSPLGVYDFIKRTSILSCTEEALQKYGHQTAQFAAMEGLDGHGNSLNVRLNAIRKA
jgi:histidinol dehydrogenase